MREGWILPLMGADQFAVIYDPRLRSNILSYENTEHNFASLVSINLSYRLLQQI